MAFSDDDTILYLAKENTIFEFEVPGGKLINSVATDSVDMPTSLSLRHGTQVLAATYGSGAVVKVEMIMLNEMEKQVDFDSWPIAGAFILDDNLVTIDEWGRIKKRPNGVSGETNWEFTELNKQIFDAVIDKASGMAALQLGDGSVELFDLASLQ